jgi:hypothetical protein
MYKLLIDSYRMREADDVNFENKTTPPSVYTGAPSSIEPFRQYLAKAATRPNLLPRSRKSVRPSARAVVGPIFGVESTSGRSLIATVMASCLCR